MDTESAAPSAPFRVQSLGWYVLFLVAFWFFPRTGEGLKSTTDWADQSLFLRTLNETLLSGTSDAMRSGLVGPGYISIARVVHMVSGLPTDRSLVLLSELCFLTAGVVLIAFAERTSRRYVADLRMPLMLFAVAALFTSTWAFAADLPWTHYQEAALLTSIVFLSTLPRRRVLVWGLIGFLAVLAYQTRPYEGAVMLIAAAGTGIVRLAMRRFLLAAADRREIVSSGVAALAGAVIADVFIYSMTRIALPVSQYSDLNSTFKIYPSLLPYKLVQLFLDTCFYTVCRSAASQPANILGNDQNFAAWHQPLSLQLPVIVAAVAAIAVVLVGSAAARRALFQPRVLFPFLLAGGAILAYAAAVPSGSPHLRYGFMRDFIVPMAMFFMALCALLTSDAGVEPGKAPVSPGGGLALAAFVTVVLVLLLLRPFSGNFLPQFALESVAYTPRCTEGLCRFGIDARRLDGSAISIPGTTVVLKHCGGAEIGEVADLADVVVDVRSCSDVALIPAVTGLFQTPNPVVYLGEPALPAAR